MSRPSRTTIGRAEQKARTRERILDGLVTLLAGGSGDLSIDQLAEVVGVSPRTVYVHFPDREALLAALDERVNRELLHQPEYRSPEELVVGVVEEHLDASSNADLVRAQLNGRVGRAIRERSRAERAERVRHALADVLEGVDPERADEALAVILLLRSIDAWKVLHDDLGLGGDRTARAVGWAMSVLLDDLRHEGRK